MDAKALYSAVAQFSTKFCNELDKTKNVVSSPLSAENLLAWVTLGSTEPAHSELLEALGFDDNDNNNSVKSAFGGLFTKLKAIKGVTLEVANKIYIKDGGYDVEPELKRDAEEIFDAEFEKMNFKVSATAAQLINQWVKQKTHDKIKDLYFSNSFSAFTRLVLVNALYFKGTFKSRFNAKDTMEQKFHINNQSSIKIPMMFKEQVFRCHESRDLQAQLLELSYVGEELSMVIVLPNKIDGLDAVMQKLADGYNLVSEFEKMSSLKVKVTLPKLKIETEINLGNVLPKHGIEAIFKQDSGLDEILNPTEKIYVSKAVQKAYIEVNEEGAEAAAGSGLAMNPNSEKPTSDFGNESPSSLGEQPHSAEVTQSAYFKADHPFLYMLVGADRGILLIGAYRGQ